MGKTTDTEWKTTLEEIEQKAEWMDTEAHYKRSKIHIKIQDKLLLIVLKYNFIWCLLLGFK